MGYKLKFEINCVDKYTNQEYKIGDVVEFEEERAKELLADPREVVSIIEDPKPGKKSK